MQQPLVLSARQATLIHRKVNEAQQVDKLVLITRDDKMLGYIKWAEIGRAVRLCQRELLCKE